MDNKKKQQQRQEQQRQEQQEQDEQCNKLATIFVECMKKPTTTATTSKAKCKKEFVAYALKC